MFSALTSLAQTKADTILYRYYADNPDLYKNKCPDTLKLLFFRKVVEMNLMLPSWQPVFDHETTIEIVGTAGPALGVNIEPPHISKEDLPLYHFTHDFCVNVVPDSEYEKWLTYYIEDQDTILRKHLHCEWESGLGGGNSANLCAEYCSSGNSCGFFTAGHERGDEFWNIPNTGDRIHLEGLPIWDRGHPPPKIEIHPMRLLAIQRKLPVKLPIANSNKFATEIDIFASGDGSTFYNNTIFTTDFTKRVKMSSKDYLIKMKNTLPKPSPNAQLKYIWRKQKGNNFSNEIELSFKDDSVFILIPWKTKNVNDEVIFAQSLYLYWDEGTGVSKEYKINAYEIEFKTLQVKRAMDFFTKAEWRLFANFGGHFVFLNELLNVNNILFEGLGKTRRQTYHFNQTFTIYVPEEMDFNIYFEGWDADGLDPQFGKIVDHNCECNHENKEKINDLMLDLNPVAINGCEDDPLGTILQFHSPKTLDKEENSFLFKSSGKHHEDTCPFGSFTPNGTYEVAYTIKKLSL